MKPSFIQTRGTEFVLDGQPIRLRGYTLGTWMNLEHFMVGLPGTHTMIRRAFADVYGKERADSLFEHFLDCMVREEDIAFLKSLGTNAVRIPFGYRLFIDDRNPSRYLESGFAALERVIGYCRKHQLYAILDLHAAPGSQNNDWHSDNMTGQSLLWQYDYFQQQTCDLWRAIASRYADDPWVVGYDVLNEPGYDMDADTLNGFYRRAISSIRQVDPNHIIFLEGSDFGRCFDLLEDPDDPQIAYAFHFYPFVLDEDVLDPTMPEEKRDAFFHQLFDKQIEPCLRFGRPLWCGESGYNIPMDQEPFTTSLILKNIQLCEERGYSWSLWTYKDAGRMGIVYPRLDSPWMTMRRIMEARWTHEY